MQDNKDNIIKVYIPKKDAKCGVLYHAISDAIDNNSGGMALATIVGVLEMVKEQWIRGDE